MPGEILGTIGARPPSLLSASLRVAREAEFTSANDVGIFVGTWNVNGKKPDLLDPVSASRATTFLQRPLLLEPVVSHQPDEAIRCRREGGLVFHHVFSALRCNPSNLCSIASCFGLSPLVHVRLAPAGGTGIADRLCELLTV